MKLLAGVKGSIVSGIKYIAMTIALASAFVSGYGYGTTLTSTKYKTKLAELESKYAKAAQVQFQAVAEAEQHARLRLQRETERVRSIMKELHTVRQSLIKERKASKGNIRNASQVATHYCVGLPPEWVRVYNQALGLTTSNSNSGSKNTYSRNTSTSSRTSRAFDPRIPFTDIRIHDATLSLGPNNDHQNNHNVGPLVKKTILVQEAIHNTRYPTNTRASTTPLYTFDPESSVSKQQTVPDDSAIHAAAKTIEEKSLLLPNDQQPLVTPQDLLEHIQDYGLYCRRIESQLRSIANLLETQK